MDKNSKYLDEIVKLAEKEMLKLNHQIFERSIKTWRYSTSTDQRH